MNRTAKYIRIIGFIALGLIMGEATTLAAVRVLLLPFDIYAQDDLAYLRKEIPRAIADDLRQENIEIIDWDALAGFQARLESEKAKGTEGIRRAGVLNGADYVLWGSMTRIGQKFSLDAKLLATAAATPPDVFFVEGLGIENLLLNVKKLAGRLTLKFFKRELIAEIRIKGTKRIEADAIKRKITTKPGDVYLLKRLTEDLKSVYSMGYFDDIQIEAEKGPKGQIITFKVQEKATIRGISIKGNTVYDDEKIQETLTLKTGSILNIYQIQKNIGRIETLYKEKNYHNVNVEHQLKPRKQNQADLVFIISEGKKTRIKEIRFVGNNAFKSKKLKRLMSTSEKGLFSFITSSGDLKKDKLHQDVAKISAFYHNHGFVQAKVGEPLVEFKQHWIYITIKIEEGQRFKVGQIQMAGDLILPSEELIAKLAITKEAFYNQQVVRKDALTLHDLYSDEGYAYAEIIPKIEQVREKRVVHITFTISKRKQVYFERILISGNTATRDKVIRRELRVFEQELYSGSRLKRGIRNLHRLDYFEDVQVDTQKGSADDKIILKMHVQEKPTGAFSFGGGYSTVDEFFLVASLEKRNFLGKGQTVGVRGKVGGTSSRYSLSFTEPWLFDIPLSAGIDLYNQTYEYNTYDKDSIGGKIRFSYPLHDFVRLYWAYSYDISDVHDIEAWASSLIHDIEGENATSKVSTTLRYDSRDRIFNPSEGSDHSATAEYAGLGGDFAFTKVVLDTGWYFPLLMGHTGFAHGKIGFVEEASGGRLPDFERFYLGGINSIRGFGWRAIHALDQNGLEIGGNKFIQINLEYQIPLFKEAGIVGILFFDTGNVYGKDEEIALGELRETAGFGFRWYSPVGPIRLEYGYILDQQPGDPSTGRWEFAMGFSFF